MPTVLVTGASGFIALHIISQLLTETDYRIHVSIRTAEKQDYLKNLFPSQQNRLFFFIADLNQDDNWDKAAEGCDYVLHVASPFPPKPTADENTLIKPAREGTMRVLAAANAAGVKRVVLTSSIAAVGFGWQSKQDFGPDDWSQLKSHSIDPYEKSKTLAEQAAWQYIQEHTPSFTLCSILPGLVVGPIIGNRISTSNMIIHKLISGQLPGSPNINIALTDVRDVAAMHIRALVNTGAANKRLIMADQNFWIAEMATILRKNGYRYAPSFTLPNIVIRFLALFDNEIAMAKQYLDLNKRFDCRLTKSILDWHPMDCKQSLLDAAESIQSVSGNSYKF